MLHFIYKLTFTASGKAYVGRTTNLGQRMRSHFSKGVLPFAEGYLLEHLASCWDYHAAINTETYLIGIHDTLVPQGFNVLNGNRHTAAMRAKIGANAIGNKRWLGRKHSEETKAKMAEKKRALVAAGWKPVGRSGPLSDAHKAAISASCMGNKHSEETKAKIRAKSAEVARKSKDTRARKIAEGHVYKANIPSAYQRAKFSAMYTGKKHSEEAKAKMRALGSERCRKGWETRRAKAALRPD